jgi:hypothetical protein
MAPTEKFVQYPDTYGWPSGKFFSSICRMMYLFLTQIPQETPQAFG